ncbi:MAG: DUF898 domain-containing protein [Rhodospirillum sp.]|nr:DUF898 domain-containing protein [Rhodospirillum sp.]MCF8488012.1 DUF898 domain-containing protein [Rhodospirillum sp.]
MDRTEAREWSGLVFTGTARDYFGIWIVNLLLGILTFGIWSAWAKVRRLRYFHGHTHVLNSSLDYLASPWVILKGRLLVVAVLIVISVVQHFFPLVAPVVALFYMGVLPWIICRSLRFNARNIVWRNVRFDFRGTWWQAFKAMILFPLLSVISLFTLVPVGARVMARFWTDNHTLGTAAFRTDTRVSAFYAAAGWSVLAFLAVGALWGPVLWFGWDAATDQRHLGVFSPLVPFLVFLGLMPPGLVAGSLFQGLVRNIMVNGLTLEGGHRFRSSLNPGRYTWIIFSNGILTLCSLGLAHPWAAVRLWRYSTETLSVSPGEDPEAFVDSQVEAGGAFGSEFTALDALDLGL